MVEFADARHLLGPLEGLRLVENQMARPGVLAMWDQPYCQRCPAVNLYTENKVVPKETVMEKRLYAVPFLAASVLLVLAVPVKAAPIDPYAYMQTSASSNDGVSNCQVGLNFGLTSYTTSLDDAGTTPLSMSSYSAYSHGGSIPEVGVSLSALASVYPTYSGASAITQNVWSFMIAPKPGFDPSVATGTLVPIDFDYTIDFTGASQGGASWFVRALIISDVFATKGITASDTVAEADSNTSRGSHVETLNVTYNTWHAVNMSLEGMVIAGGYTSSSATLDGFIDPAIILGPAWLADHPNDQVFISSVSAVPEPGTLSLLAMGGLAMLRRRRK